MAKGDPEKRLLRELGRRMAEIRHERGVTQAHVAEIASIDPQSYQRAESGRAALSVVRLKRVADALGVPLAELFAGVGEPLPETPWETRSLGAAAAWRRIPEDRRDLAMRILAELAT